MRADRIRLKQAIVNLGSNGVKYNHPHGQVVVKTERRTDGRIRIMIRDTGPGIPADRMTDLFKPFNRLGQEHSGIEGLGIGLVLTKRMIEAMGGSIGVESAIGSGSTFWIELPEAPPQLITAAISSTAMGVELPKATILHVEDNLLNMALVRFVIEPYPQIRLIEAGTGTMGLDLAFAHRPDLILLDINLPGIDGIEIVKRLKEDIRTRGIPVIAISAAAMPKDIERAMQYGFDEYLVKPVNVKKLLAALARYLHRMVPDIQEHAAG